MKLVYFSEQGGGVFGFQIQHKDKIYCGKAGRQEFKSKFWEPKQIGAILRGEEIRQLSNRKIRIVIQEGLYYLCIKTFFRKNDHCDEVQETNSIRVRAILGASGSLVKRETKEPDLTSASDSLGKRENKESELTGATLKRQRFEKEKESCKTTPETVTKDAQIKELTSRVKHLEETLILQTSAYQQLEKYAQRLGEQLGAIKESMSVIVADNAERKSLFDLMHNQQCQKQDQSESMRNVLQILCHATPFECRFYYNTPRTDRLPCEVVVNVSSRSEQKFFHFLCNHPRFRQFKTWLEPRHSGRPLYSIVLRNVPRDCEWLLNPIDVFKFGKMNHLRHFFYPSGGYAKCCRFEQNDLDFLVAMYEINLEFELHDKVLLPSGSSVVAKSIFLQCMPQQAEDVEPHTFSLKTNINSPRPKDAPCAEKDNAPCAEKDKLWSDRIGYFASPINLFVGK